jgi:hypothetical protein
MNDIVFLGGKPNRLFRFAGWGAMLSAFILFTVVLTQAIQNEELAESLVLISLIPAIPTALALRQVRRPLGLTLVSVASAMTWAIVLGSIILNFFNPSLIKTFTPLLSANVLLWVTCHLIWTVWAGFLFLTERLVAPPS